MAEKKYRSHHLETGITVKWEHVKEQSREWEMRDSSGYSIPHTSNRLDLIYTLASKNDISSQRVEAYAQDTYRWTGSEGETFYTLC